MKRPFLAAILLVAGSPLILLTPAVRAAAPPAVATAYYEPGSVNAGRPGTCFVNTYDLKARPKWEMEALALHECTPGHHLQVAIAQEIKKPPKVLNYHDYTAFAEGWGVYAETLAAFLVFQRWRYGISTAPPLAPQEEGSHASRSREKDEE